MSLAPSCKQSGPCKDRAANAFKAPIIPVMIAHSVFKHPSYYPAGGLANFSEACSAFGSQSSLQPWRISTTCNNSHAHQISVRAMASPAREREVATTLDAQSSADASGPPPPASDSSALRSNMQSRYEQAYSMSQLYAAERPPPIPPSEHERRRRVKDIQEVVDAGRRKGLKEDVTRNGLTQMDALLPGVLSLHRMKPSDWATVASDVSSLAEKIILLKSLYPTADIFKIVFKKPKLLLLSTKRLEQDAAVIMRLLSSAPNPCAILESTPDLVDPLSLSRCLASLATSFPGQDPVMMLQQHPDILANLGAEAAVELTAEYGELSTKD
ncbi:hypothetical protein Vretifemale_4567 [Volvox reticuliferus]|uniref:Uncharacterized protein n=1 Tax=Volvox reticuliferus TaxID=1737510 RepID=A0A8J4C388_9CHLO|nr:hypothetical protein Vretifemale_4567 [Volvox reticuliferus]